MIDTKYGQQYGRILQPWIYNIVEQDISSAIDRVYALLALSKKTDNVIGDQHQVPLFPRNIGPRNPHRSQLIADKGSGAAVERLNKVIDWPILHLNKRVIIRQIPGLTIKSGRASVVVTLNDGKHFTYGVIPIEGDENPNHLQCDAGFSSTQDTIIIIRKASIRLSPPFGANASIKVCELYFNIQEYVSIRYPGPLTSTYDPSDLSSLDQITWQLVRLTMYGIPCNPRWKDISFPITRNESRIPSDQMKILGYRIRSQRGRKTNRLSGGCSSAKTGKVGSKAKPVGILISPPHDVPNLSIVPSICNPIAAYSVRIRTPAEPYWAIFVRWVMPPRALLCLLSTLAVIEASLLIVDPRPLLLARLGLGTIARMLHPVGILPAPRSRPRRREGIPPTLFRVIIRTKGIVISHKYTPPGRKWRRADTLRFVSQKFAAGRPV